MLKLDKHAQHSGVFVTFRDCDFGKSYSTAAKSAFEFANAAKILGGSVTFSKTIEANINAVPRQDFVRFNVRCAL